MKNIIRPLVHREGKHLVYADSGTWYDEARNIIEMKHHLHCALDKKLMEGINRYEGWNRDFDDYYAYVKRIKTRRRLEFIHLRSWIQFVVQGIITQ